MFDLEKQIFGAKSAKIVASQSAKQSLEQQQRDVYDSHRHRAFALAFYMTGNEVEAEQILIRTFTRAFAAPSLPDANGIDRSLLQELRETGALEEQDATPPPTAGEQGCCGNIRRTELEEAVQTLPGSERMIFLLHDVERYTPSNIARLLDLTESEVSRTLIYARIRLRQALAASQSSRREAA